MDLRRITYFTRIAELGNMTRASEALGVAQPALSQQLAGLEEDLGTRLFNRSTAGMALTSAGEVFYRHALAILKQMEDAVAAVRDETGQPTGRVKIGLPGSTSKIIAIPLLSRIGAHPGIMLEIVERPSSELPALVASGWLDLSVVVDARKTLGVQILPLVLEDLVVLTPITEVTGNTLTLNRIAAQPLVLPSLPSSIRQRIDSAFLQARLPYQLVAEISTTDMLVRVIAAGLGWTILPWSAGGELLQYGHIRAARIEDHDLTREVALCLPDSAPLSLAAETVRVALIEIVEEAVSNGNWQGARSISVAKTG